MPTIQIQVSNDDDDAFTTDSNLAYGRGTNFLDVGHESTALNRFESSIGMRFDNINIPQGSNITSATLEVKANGSESGAVCNSKINGEAVDDASSMPAGRVAFLVRMADSTTAVVNWNGVAAFTDGVWYFSPDISSIIQEIVDRPGWGANNGMAIYWRDDEGNSDDLAFRRIFSHDSGIGDDAPKLNVTYRSSGQIMHIQRG